ncbi:MAG TPA: alpha/beta hydrolase family protein [Candidatus Polarisedimenticolia bacterium]|nr:alpha/beta hydrolase family protein [Candidatus Polarisedimenticolia bacterium]
MLRPVAQLIDDYRIWHKVTFQRGRILTTRGRDWEAFDRRELFDDPRLFYGDGRTVPAVVVRHARSTPLAEISRFSFPALHPIERYPYAETNRASGILYRPRAARDGPAVVLSHGWAHDETRAIELLFVEPLLQAGLTVALVEHPFHFRRAPAGTYSGELMVSGDVVLTVEAFRQGVADLSGVASWLMDQGMRTGVLGYSLGGYMAALLACLRDDLAFVVVGAAGASVVSPILDTGLGVNVREDLSRSGMDHRESLERAWGIISPARLAPRVSGDRILLVAGSFDRIMLAESVAALWRRWGRPSLLWERQGHYSLLAVPGRLIRRSIPFILSW